MYTPFENINPASRIWIYQSSRLFTAQEEETIQKLGQQFVAQWTAHSQDLLASFSILKHLFVIVAVDYSIAGASGCSIDKSIAFIQSLEKELQVSLLNRRMIAYEQGGEIKPVTLDEFEKLYKSGIVDSQVITYNNLLDTRLELESKWRIPMNQSWLMQLM